MHLNDVILLDNGLEMVELRLKASHIEIKTQDYSVWNLCHVKTPDLLVLRVLTSVISYQNRYTQLYNPLLSQVISLFVIWSHVGSCNESISLSSSKSYRRAEIGYVMKVNFIRK